MACAHGLPMQLCTVTLQDGLFTLSEMECMGSCVNAPMIAVADYSGPDVTSFSYQYYEDLTTDDTVTLLEDLKAGRKPKKVTTQMQRKEGLLCAPWCIFGGPYQGDF